MHNGRLQPWAQPRVNGKSRGDPCKLAPRRSHLQHGETYYVRVGGHVVHDAFVVSLTSFSVTNQRPSTFPTTGLHTPILKHTVPGFQTQAPPRSQYRLTCICRVICNKSQLNQLHRDSTAIGTSFLSGASSAVKLRIPAGNISEEADIDRTNSTSARNTWTTFNEYDRGMSATYDPVRKIGMMCHPEILVGG